VKEVEELEKGNVDVDKIGEEPKESLQVFTNTNNNHPLISKKISLPTSTFEVSDYAEENELSNTITNPETSTHASTADQGRSTSQSSMPPMTEEEPPVYEFQIYERPTTIEEAQIDENQELQPVSLLEKIERPGEGNTTESYTFQKANLDFPEELPKFPLFSDDVEDWFLKADNKKTSEV